MSKNKPIRASLAWSCHRGHCVCCLMWLYLFVVAVLGVCSFVFAFVFVCCVLCSSKFLVVFPISKHACSIIRAFIMLVSKCCVLCFCRFVWSYGLFSCFLTCFVFFVTEDVVQMHVDGSLHFHKCHYTNGSPHGSWPVCAYRNVHAAVAHLFYHAAPCIASRFRRRTWFGHSSHFIDEALFINRIDQVIFEKRFGPRTKFGHSSRLIDAAFILAASIKWYVFLSSDVRPSVRPIVRPNVG